MKRKFVIKASILFLAFAALAFCVFAQKQTDQGQDSAKPSGPGPYVQGQGIGRPPEKGIILLRTVFREDGTLQGFQTMPTGSNPDPVLGGKIRIEMLDGSIHTFDLMKVKKITIE